MINKYLFFLCIFLSLKLFANDGAFYAKGNHLIPINDTDISVKKEILTLKKIRNKLIEVTVYYEFFNPSKEKQITVGFEAFAPEGDVDGTPKNNQHPYMRDFTVEHNDKVLKYEVAYVSDSLYNNGGKIKSLGLNTFVEGIKGGNYTDFYYVYHFNVKFKKGINIIKHTYNYDLSGSVDKNYALGYVLTAANRWANKQIDNFTLIVDMGEFETFFINKTFFNNDNDWLINGIGKKKTIQAQTNEFWFIENNAVKFNIQKGNLIFQKKNFKPQGELYLFATNYYYTKHNGNNELLLPFSYYQQDRIPEPQNDFEKKVLKNLPFARRGYIFKNEELNNYYRKQEWYIPNPNYMPNSDNFSEIEMRWIEKWK